ncbi:hypothetical protein [Nostoc sp.]|uniref:hypothetical protein n=1 Tax=Nostoc sp. TaxID=1180 RepID=UPI002FF895D7
MRLSISIAPSRLEFAIAYFDRASKLHSNGGWKPFRLATVPGGSITIIGRHHPKKAKLPYWVLSENCKE